MKVVVTGGTGMIGRKLISSLLATPELIDRDGHKAEVTSITASCVRSAVARAPTLATECVVACACTSVATSAASSDSAST